MAGCPKKSSSARLGQLCQDGQYKYNQLASIWIRSLMYVDSFSFPTTGQSAMPHASPLRLLQILMSPDSWKTKLSEGNQQTFLLSLYSYLINKGKCSGHLRVFIYLDNKGIGC